MALINPTLPTVGQDRGTEEIDTLNALVAILGVVNGGIDLANLSATLTAQLVFGTGKSIIAIEETRTTDGYGLMPTPDQVQGVQLPTDGLLLVAFQAMFKSPSAGGKCGVFLDANQVKVAQEGVATPVVVEAQTSGADSYRAVAAHSGGLVAAAGVTAYGGHVTTGQVVGVGTTETRGGFMAVFAAAGTYDVSVRWDGSASLTTRPSAKDRKLWVMALGF